MPGVLDELKKIDTSIYSSYRQSIINVVAGFIQKGQIDAAIQYVKQSEAEASSVHKPFFNQILSLLEQSKVENQINNSISSYQNSAENTVNQSLYTKDTKESVINTKVNEYQNQVVNLLDYKPFTLPKDYVVGDLVVETGITIDELEKQLGYHIVPGQVIPKGTTLYVPRFPSQSREHLFVDDTLQIGGNELGQFLSGQQVYVDDTLDRLQKAQGISVTGEADAVVSTVDEAANTIRAIADGALRMMGGSIEALTDELVEQIKDKFGEISEFESEALTKLYDSLSYYWDKVSYNLQRTLNAITDYVLPSLGAFLQIASLWLPGLQGLFAFMIGQFTQMFAATIPLLTTSADDLDRTLTDFIEKGNKELNKIQDTESLPPTLF